MDSINQTKRVKINLQNAFDDADITITGTNKNETVHASLSEQKLSDEEADTNNMVSKMMNESIQLTADNLLRLTRNSDSIQQMEKLKEQVRSIIDPPHNDYNCCEEKLNISSSSSVDTLALLKEALPPDTSPQMLPVEDVLMSSLNSSSHGKSSKQIAQAYLDTSLIAENTILKETAGRERARRKNCEEEVNNLQNKLLECQEQLAAALSMERKKSLMVEQLDKTIGIVVEGWKKLESERVSSIENLALERDGLLTLHEKQEKMLKQFEVELSSTMKAVAREQDKLNDVSIHHKRQVDFLEDQKTKIQKQVSEQQRVNLRLEEENKHALKLIEKYKSQIEDMMKNQNKEQEHHLAESRQTNEQFTAIKETYEKKISQLTDKMLSSDAELQDMRRQKETFGQEIQKRDSDLITFKKEKETLVMQLSLLQTKYDTLKTKQDSELTSKLEEEFNQQVLDIQKQIVATEETFRQQQRKQISELSLKHKEDLQKIQMAYEKEVKNTKEEICCFRDEQGRRLQESENQVMLLQEQNKKLENHRSELLSRLKYIMEQQWQQTISAISHSNIQEDIPEQLSSTCKNEMRADYSTPHLNRQSTITSSFPRHLVSNLPNPRHYSANTLQNSTKSIVPNSSDYVIYNSNEIPRTMHNSELLYSNLEYPSRDLPVKNLDDPISLLYQDLDDNEDDASLVHTEKQVQLTHFIEKLLQKSPSIVEQQENVKQKVERLLEDDTSHYKRPDENKSLSGQQIVDLRAVLQSSSGKVEEKVITDILKQVPSEERPSQRRTNKNSVFNRLQKTQTRRLQNNNQHFVKSGRSKSKITAPNESRRAENDTRSTSRSFSAWK